MPDFEVERRLIEQGFWPVAGVDEVGRGPLAGPVCAAAVILDPDNLPAGLDDSKKLSAARRAKLFDDILKRALAVSFASLPAATVDRINIRQATLRAMTRACHSLSLKPAFALIDGNDPPALSFPSQAIVKGDARCLSIAAASIVAKVLRDRMMARLDVSAPGYGFAQNAGYGAPAHLRALRELGPSSCHRMSFSPLRTDQFDFFRK